MIDWLNISSGSGDRLLKPCILELVERWDDHPKGVRCVFLRGGTDREETLWNFPGFAQFDAAFVKLKRHQGSEVLKVTIVGQGFIRIDFANGDYWGVSS